MKASRLPPLYTCVVLTIIIVSAVLLVSCGQVGSQGSTGSTPITSARTSSLPTPTAKLIPARASSGHSVALTLVDGVAYLGTADNIVYALRMSNGAVLWRQQVDGSVNSQPIVSNGRVYVSSYAGQNGPGYVYALQASDGSVLWRHTFNGYTYLTLAGDGGILYVAAQDGIDALLTSDGYILWHFSTTGVSSDNPVVSDGVIYTSSSLNGTPGTLDALDASTGRLLWQYREGDYVSVSIASNGVLYIDSNDGTLAALRADNGRLVWQRKIDANLIQSLQLVNGVIYTSVTKITYISAVQSSSPFQGVASIGSLFWNASQTASNRLAIPDKEGVSSVYAIRSSDGGILWHYPLLNGQDAWSGWFSVANNFVYVGAFSTTSQLSAGDIYALQSSNGTVIWHDTLRLNPYNALLANGIIYLSSSDGNSGSGAIYAIHANDGAFLWSYPIDGEVYNAPALAGAALFIGAENGVAYALQTGNGTIMWHFQTDVGF